ncbi:transposable element Tcb2 transposase [Trichonephila clavipes]|nr:transposable element Tcb2 transposase [Trichonephila clavipes]
MCSRRHGGGRVRSTTPAEGQIYRPISKKEQAHHRSADSTVLPVCNGVVSITIGLNRTGHAYYYSDESRFSLSSDCRRQLIWRESGTAYRPENIQQKDRISDMQYHGVGASIMINGRTRLHVVANVTMMDQRYIDEVLLPHVRLFRGAVGDKFVFIDDNAACHRTLAVQDCLRQRGVFNVSCSQRVLQI